MFTTAKLEYLTPTRELIYTHYWTALPSSTRVLSIVDLTVSYSDIH
jgi:hypothetical protein